MRHAYSRVKRENSEKALQWNRAIRTLRRGDHYILVLWGHPLSHNSPRDWAIFLVVGLPIVAYWWFAFFFLPRRNGSWPYSNYIPHVNPHIMQALLLSLIIVAIFFPQILLKPADWWFGLLDRFIDPRKTHGQAE